MNTRRIPFSLVLMLALCLVGYRQSLMNEAASAASTKQAAVLEQAPAAHSVPAQKQEHLEVSSDAELDYVLASEAEMEEMWSNVSTREREACTKFWKNLRVLAVPFEKENGTWGCGVLPPVVAHLGVVSNHEAYMLVEREAASLSKHVTEPTPAEVKQVMFWTYGGATQPQLARISKLGLESCWSNPHQEQCRGRF